MKNLLLFAPETLNKIQYGEPGKCWVWTGTRDRLGYGRVSKYPYGTALAHRVVYTMYKGEIPLGRGLDHLCRNPSCVNPEHLEPVTQRENVMRSPIAPTALNSRKTQCKNGHEYTPENTFARQRPGRHPERECLTCRRNIRNVANQKLRARKRAERKALGLNWQNQPYKKQAYALKP